MWSFKAKKQRRPYTSDEELIRTLQSAADNLSKAYVAAKDAGLSVYVYAKTGYNSYKVTESIVLPAHGFSISAYRVTAIQ